jgi:ribonuclease HI
MLMSNGLPELSSVAERPSQEEQRHRRTIHVSPLCSIVAQAEAEGAANLSNREKIPPFVAPPWWHGADIHIASGDDEARLQHDVVVASEDNACIYTDGSCIQGHTGAAAVWPVKQQTKRAYMGPETTSTVYAAELQGICLALGMVQAELHQENRNKHTHIFADNQAAIRSVAKPEGRSGAYITKQIVQKIDDLKTAGLSVDIHWIPAHEGIDGNEAAD